MPLSNLHKSASVKSNTGCATRRELLGRCVIEKGILNFGVGVLKTLSDNRAHGDNFFASRGFCHKLWRFPDLVGQIRLQRVRLRIQYLLVLTSSIEPTNHPMKTI
jgi:hypothetical protein